MVLKLQIRADPQQTRGEHILFAEKDSNTQALDYRTAMNLS